MYPQLRAISLAMGWAATAAKSREVSLFGDSRAYLSHYENDDKTNIFNRNVGSAMWTQAYSGGCVTVPWYLNGGVAGQHTDEIRGRQAAHMDLMISYGCYTVIIFAGTNDWPAGHSLNYIKQNIRGMVQDFQDRGISVILVTETPRGYGDSEYELSDENKANHKKLHDWMEDEMSKYCCTVNLWDDLVDTSSGTNYYIRRDVTLEGIHLNKLGGSISGQKLGPVAAAMTCRPPLLLNDNTGFDADAHPWASLTANPMVSGTGGNIDGGCNPVAGSQLADDWSASTDGFTGLTAKFSKETDSDGLEWQRVDIAGTTGADNCDLVLSVDIDISTMAENDTLKCSGLVRTSGTGLSNVGIQLLKMGPAWCLNSDSDDSEPDLPWPSTDTGAITRETPKLVFLAADSWGGLQPRVQIDVLKNSTVSATVWFTRCGAFKVR